MEKKSDLGQKDPNPERRVFLGGKVCSLFVCM